MSDAFRLSPAVLSLILRAASARRIPRGGNAALLARLEAMAADLFPAGADFLPALFAAGRMAPEAGTPPPSLWDIGNAFWLANSPGREKRRLEGSFYTPPGVIDRVLDLAWPRLFPDGRTGEAEPSVCDPALGCGFFFIRLLERAMAAGWRMSALRAWAASALHGVDNDPVALFMARVLLWLALSGSETEFVPDPAHFRAGDSLLGRPFGSAAAGTAEPAAGGLDWPSAFRRADGAGGFDVIVANPPYGVLTNFARRPERRDLALALRASDRYRDSLAGQVNLYRCFIERSLDLLKPGGVLAMVVPLSLARDANALPLRRRLLAEHAASEWLLFGENDNLFPGVTQSTCVFRATKNGGGAVRLRIVSAGGGEEASFVDLERLGGGRLVVPLFDRGTPELLSRIVLACPDRLSDAAEARVGEVDQTVHRACMSDGDTGCLLARGVHLSPFRLDARPVPGKGRFLDLPRFLAMKRASAEPCRARAAEWRVAQLGIRNMLSRPRLAAALVPPGVYLGNSLNVYRPKGGLSPEYLAGMLNSAILDWLFCLGSGNNNINLCEMLCLPFPARPSGAKAEAVAAAYRRCAEIAEAEAEEAGRNELPGARARLDAAAAACYGVPEECVEELRRVRTR